MPSAPIKKKKSNEVFGNSTDVNETIAQESGLAKETPTTDSKTATAKAAKTTNQSQVKRQQQQAKARQQQFIL